MAKIKANGIEIEYDVAGPEDGTPLLLIMGFGSQMTSWTPSFRDALVAAGHRVIRFDNRDVGLTQRFPGGRPRATWPPRSQRARRPTCPII